MCGEQGVDARVRGRSAVGETAEATQLEQDAGLAVLQADPHADTTGERGYGDEQTGSELRTCAPAPRAPVLGGDRRRAQQPHDDEPRSHHSMPRGTVRLIEDVR